MEITCNISLLISQVFEFLKQKNFVVDLLRHIGTSAISDLVLRLITCVDGTDIKQARAHINKLMLLACILASSHENGA